MTITQFYLFFISTGCVHVTSHVALGVSEVGLKKKNNKKQMQLWKTEQLATSMQCGKPYHSHSSLVAAGREREGSGLVSVNLFSYLTRLVAGLTTGMGETAPSASFLPLLLPMSKKRGVEKNAVE